jgi:DNA-directed RNA polymerase specialized sigma24 family protein
MVTIGDIVIERCNAQAVRWNAGGPDAYGAIFLKVCDNLRSLDHLEKPLEHFVRKTADYEARRYFHKEKNAVRSCVPAAAFEYFAIDRDSDVLESLVKAEDRERLLNTLPELSPEQREALLVREGVQALDAEGINLPKSLRELAKRRGRSLQHRCNLAKRAERRLRNQLR